MSALPDAVQGSGSVPLACALVVDDDEFVRNVVARQLAALGLARVEQAEDGRQARAVLDGPHPPDLIVCDLMMPGADGVELLREIAERQPQAALILMSSADSKLLRSAEQLALSRRLHVLGSLRKPVQPATLKTLLAGLHRPRVAAPPALRSNSEVGEATLCAALADGHLGIAVQPQLSLLQNRIEGVEALVRLCGPAPLAWVTPDRFLAAAERCGLMDALTDRVLQVAIAAAGRWRAAGLPLRVSINVPAASLARLALPDQIAALAQAAHLPLSDIVVEVTETRLLEDLVDPLDVLMRLRLRGIELSIDDFGTGYSSLERLQAFPFTELKIDRGFVGRAVRDSGARRIVESSVRLAHDLGLRTVAEGVESRTDVELMRALGCDTVQGYHVARPMPADELPGWLARF